LSIRSFCYAVEWSPTRIYSIQRIKETELHSTIGFLPPGLQLHTFNPGQPATHIQPKCAIVIKGKVVYFVARQAIARVEHLLFAVFPPDKAHGCAAQH